MKNTNKILKASLFVMLSGFMASANATIWTISEVLTGAGVSGYGASSFHRATDATPMSGADLGTITAGAGNFGTYDDMTGAFSGTFNLTGAGGPTFTLSGTLDFSDGSDIWLDALAILTLNFAGSDLSLGDGDPISMYYEGKNVCCNTTNAPNSIIDSTGGSKIITLWGANGYDEDNETFAGGDDTNLGNDLRFRITSSQVPEPSSVLLMGLGLLGLAARRRFS